MQTIPDLGNGDILTEEFTQNVKANFDGLASDAAASGASLVIIETGTLPGSGGDVQSVLEAQKQINEENGGLIAVNTALREELASTAVGSGGSMVAFDTTTHSTSGDDVQEVVDSLLTALGFIEASSQSEAETKTNQSKYISPKTARGAAGTASTETAGEDIDGSSTPQAVHISDGTGSRTTGRYYKSDPDDLTNGANKFDGFVEGDKTTGQTDLLINSNLVDGFAGLTTGDIYYLDPSTPGSITTTENNYPVGKAISATEILIIKGATVAVKANASGEQLWLDDTVYTTASSSYVSKGLTKKLNILGNITFSVELDNDTGGQNTSFKVSYTDKTGAAQTLEFTSDTSPGFETKTGVIYPAVGTDITFELKTSGSGTGSAKNMKFLGDLVNSENSKIL